MTFTTEGVTVLLRDIYEEGGEGLINTEKYSEEVLKEAKDLGLIELDEEANSPQSVLLTIKGTNYILQHDEQG